MSMREVTEIENIYIKKKLYKNLTLKKGYCHLDDVTAATVQQHQCIHQEERE